jgi:hypothetical protein
MYIYPLFSFSHCIILYHYFSSLIVIFPVDTCRYIFPGVGLGAIAVGAQIITDDDFTVAAECLASLVSEERLAQAREIIE